MVGQIPPVTIFLWFLSDFKFWPLVRICTAAYFFTALIEIWWSLYILRYLCSLLATDATQAAPELLQPGPGEREVGGGDGLGAEVGGEEGGQRALTKPNY